ncbi:MAG TPA: serine/threonine-protein kinase [Myxococcaceae bacterium]|nr:serine/threonine-protein kinase [Myxococcaceae bacterium]
METLGKYELIRKLAVGGMAEVFLAKSGGAMGFTKTVVLKRILPHLADDPRFVEMFLREAKIAAELTHPNVVQIFDFGESEGRYYIAMEYVDGPNMRGLVKRAVENRAPVPLPMVARLISYACEGLGFAHAFTDPETGKSKDIVHRDISPDNILVSRTGALKVADFGLAKALDSQNLTQAGMLKGKIPYLAPEQIRGKGADRRTDIYALGITLYELCTGRRPFEAENDVALMSAVANEPPPPPQKLRPDLAPELISVIERSLRKNPDQRFQTCREMQGELDAYLRQHDFTIGPFEIAEYVKQADAIPRSPTGKFFPAAEKGDSPPTRAERATPSSPSVAPPAEKSPPKGSPAPPSGPNRPPPQVARGAPRPSQPREGSVPSVSLDGVATKVKQLVADVPPERRPFLYVGGGVVALLLVVLVALNAGGSEDFGGNAALVVDSVPAGRVKINGRELGKTPRTLTSLPAGAVLVEVYDPDLPFSKQQLMTLSPGDNGLRRFVIAKEPVELKIYPQAKVNIDGRDVGLSPLPAISLYEGTHRIRLTYVGTSVETESEFVVKAGEPNVVKKNLGVDTR